MRDPEVTSRIMSAVGNRNTSPEMALRSALWKEGLRFRVKSKLFGKPDIVFPGARVTVFVDGDFWHGNAWRIRGMESFDAQFERINNGERWKAKISRNMERDRTVDSRLSGDGWCVYRVFESRIKKDLAGVTAEISDLVRSRCKDRTVRLDDSGRHKENPCQGR
ncbi:very short patch repair endonuclease [Streptomyces erythrochromogenes]|uniref:very short patch repair endonuclease n=1 Tax=Streptomyces erythrochromogenes TaxID=285574 RepID=UPI0036282A30